MKTLLNTRKSKIQNGEPLTELGLIFYPIKMTYYDTATNLMEVLLIRQGTLPAKYLAYDYLNAVFNFSLDNGKKGVLFQIMILLFLSLRIDIDVKELFRYVVLTENGVEKFIINQNGKTVEISALEFSTIVRPLIVEQNGFKIPDETENIDIIKDYEYLQSKGKIDLNSNSNDLIVAVATYHRKQVKEIMEWTIKEFQDTVKAITRLEQYRIYAQAEMGGMVTFKTGNPVPSWCYDKLDNNFGTVDYQQIQKTLGGVAQPK